MYRQFKKTVQRALLLVRDLLNVVFKFQEVAILCYHSISHSTHDTAVTPQAFEAHLVSLKRRGYVFVSLSDIVRWVAGERALPRKAVALTFDDGYADFETALPLLEKYQAPATVFVVGEPALAQYRMDEAPFLSLDTLERLQQNPLVEIGFHSKTHPDLSKIKEGDLPKEVTAPFPARYFAYPGGNHSPQAAQALKPAGYKAAFTIRPVLVHRGMDPYLLPRSVILKHMSPRDVVARTTRAADWYRAVVIFAKR